MSLAVLSMSSTTTSATTAATSSSTGRAAAMACGSSSGAVRLNPPVVTVLTPQTSPVKATTTTTTTNSDSSTSPTKRPPSSSTVPLTPAGSPSHSILATSPRPSSPTASSPRSVGASTISAPSSPTESQMGVYSYLDSFIKSLNKVLATENDTASTAPLSLSPTMGGTSQTPTIASQAASSDWQANYLSPGHTKLKREGRQLEPHKEKDINALRAKFNGVLPFFRVWELKVEEMENEPPTMGRGTPPRPHRQIFSRELSATRLFLKDYQKRRGLTRAMNGVNETQVDPSSLRRIIRHKPMPTTINPEPAQPKGKTAKTQSLSPDRLLEQQRKRSNLPSRQQSKLQSLSE